MTPECIPDESLAALTSLAPGDRKREHLAGCPRCRARLASYLSFLRSDDVAGADPDDADARLTAALAHHVPADRRCHAARVGAGLAARWLRFTGGWR